MPLKEINPMNQRKEFAVKAMKTNNFRKLCNEYGISAKTGYKWKRRFMEDGYNGIKEQSRKPKHHPATLSEEEVCRIVKLREAHSSWGAKKISVLYERKYNRTISQSSFKRIFEKCGFVKKRRKKRSHEGGRIHSGYKAEAPNEVWTVDFKGWWYDQQGERCEPLTVRDEASRFLLLVKRVENARGETVKECFEELFKTYGLPKTIRSDNGSPFASANALLGLSKLSAWWVALGINLERGRPGHPQDNGAHERMHRDMKRELQGFHCDQDAIDLWREAFNRERPHEALGMRFPAQCYKKSSHRYKETPEDLIYENMISRRVHQTGMIRFEENSYFLSSALAGWSVGLKKGNTALIEVWFANLLLGFLDPETFTFNQADNWRKK